MKCDELEFFFGGAASWAEVYKKSDVDEAIAELKEENRATKRAPWLARAERAHDRSMIILRDSGMMFAVGKCHEWDILNSLQKKWQRVADKCRKKAEEHKL